MRKPLSSSECARRSALRRLAKLPSCTTHPPAEADERPAGTAGRAGDFAAGRPGDSGAAPCCGMTVPTPGEAAGAGRLVELSGEPAGEAAVGCAGGGEPSVKV